MTVNWNGCSGITMTIEDGNGVDLTSSGHTQSTNKISNVLDYLLDTVMPASITNVPVFNAYNSSAGVNSYCILEYTWEISPAAPSTLTYSND